ncbi:MAG: malto-oligosyltrehalose trehalohydrolase [Verrucomicrobiales bacterium]
MSDFKRSLPVGAEPQLGGGVHFRVWAPASREVCVELYSDPEAKTPRSVFPLRPEVTPSTSANNYFSGFIPDAGAGPFYKIKLDHGSFPDPASRFQPQGPHGVSQVVDPSSFPWEDQFWLGRPRHELVMYEMHVGTFTPEGTWKAAAEQLQELADLGITCIEIMPVADFPGSYGWGYDGVNLFAPTRLYGTPEDLKRFNQKAHQLGIMVILDVVYNHLGPDGNFLKDFSADYFTDRYKNEWGEALNFDGENSGPVREFFISNAAYWVREYHFDGLRLDATQQIFDNSPVNIQAEISQAVRKAAGQRITFLVGENEPQQPIHVRSIEENGYGLDALWNDDLHHSAIVALTGKNEAYYSDYHGRPQEFISAAKYGYLYQGQWYKWQQKRRAAPALKHNPLAFVNFIQNHDQVANSLRGARIHSLSSPGALRAMTALLYLMPGIPMIFQGQEFNSSNPFLYFADHNPELCALVAKGRREFLKQFPSIASAECKFKLAHPGSRETFEQSKLNLGERKTHAEIYQLHKDLIRLRSSDPAFSNPGEHRMDGAVLSESAFVLRYFLENGNDRLLLVNMGTDVHLNPSPEPLLAPVEGKDWEVLWSSDDPAYGGCGSSEPETIHGFRLPGQAAIVLVPNEQDPLQSANTDKKN